MGAASWLRCLSVPRPLLGTSRHPCSNASCVVSWLLSPRVYSFSLRCFRWDLKNLEDWWALLASKFHNHSSSNPKTRRTDVNTKQSPPLRSTAGINKYASVFSSLAAAAAAQPRVRASQGHLDSTTGRTIHPR